MQEIAINTDKLGRDIENLRNVLRELKKDKTKMVQEIQELNAMWSGTANQAFNVQFNADCQSFDSLIKMIEEMIQALEAAKRDYEQCDNKVNSIVSAIRI